MIAEVCAWVDTVRGVVRAGVAAVFVGIDVGADGVFGKPAVVVDVGDATAAARAVFVDGKGTAPGDAPVLEPESCGTEASLAALSFFSRAASKSNCKKFSPADCRLRGGFDSFWAEDVDCIGV
jgi:hypothetical protein